MSGINLAKKLDTFSEHWHPKTVGQFNGHHPTEHDSEETDPVLGT